MAYRGALDSSKLQLSLSQGIVDGMRKNWKASLPFQPWKPRSGLWRIGLLLTLTSDVTCLPDEVDEVSEEVEDAS